MKNKTPFLATIVLSLFLLSSYAQTGNKKEANIVEVKPTAFFKKSTNGALKRVVWVKVENTTTDQTLVLKTAVDQDKLPDQPINLASGHNEIELLIPDLQTSATLQVSLFNPRLKKNVAQHTETIHPQKKWTMYCVTYSHHDLGYGDIPHRLRRDNRMENMELMLQYCAQTDSWPNESKYHAVLETSEPITSYLSYCNKEKAQELANRINEGRIQVSGIHTTVNTEMLGHEAMARLFYLSNRHSVDLLNIRPSTSVNFDDVIGITLPFYTFAKEAGIQNLFHGYNSPRMKFQLPAQDDPLFYMQGADGDTKKKVLVRSSYYSGDAIRHPSSQKTLGEDVVQGIADRYEAANWPFDALLSQDGWDFTLLTLDNASRIKALNSVYEYPRMICSTMDMFFNAIRSQSNETSFKTYSKDGNNQWADQPSSNAKTLGIARQMDELLPAAEKMAAINSIITGALYPWSDIYQGFHRLLLFHEHTCGSSAFKPTYQYAVEEQEIAEMVLDAAHFGNKALHQAEQSLASAITTKSENTCVAFNTLNFTTSQSVSFNVDSDGKYKVIDNASGKEVNSQQTGNALSFFASEVPPMGYKTYSIVPQKKEKEKPSAPFNHEIENEYYKIVFDPESGSIASLTDKVIGKELLDHHSPYKMNEYLYEHYNTPDNKKESQFYRANAKRFEYTKGEVFDRVIVHQEGEGCKSIRQSITLHHKKKQIDFTMNIDKASSGRNISLNNAGKLTNKEAMYIALPFAVSDYHFEQSLPGMSIEPIRQMFDSVSTASYAIRHFATVYNKDFGITVSPIQAGLVQYGFPRSDAMPGFWGTEHLFEKDPTYPQNSSMYLYLLNNMFDVNITVDQPGEKEFSYAITSYQMEGANQAERFGWEYHNPVQLFQIKGKQQGKLSKNEHSFLSTDRENVVCTTIKRAEENGEGYIVRFVETSGEQTKARVSIPLFQNIERIISTDLVETNSSTELPLLADHSFELDLPPYGVRTIRILCQSQAADQPIALPTIEATAVNDMQIQLRFANQSSQAPYTLRIYRDTHPLFTPSLLTYIGETCTKEYTDAPVHRFGNWINNILLPETNYYYKVVAYDSNNRKIAGIAEAACKTDCSKEKNRIPLAISGLSAYVVSHVSEDNYINVHWRSNCEPDVIKYEVYKSKQKGFIANEQSRVAVIDVLQPGNGSKYNLNEYDHQMFPDKEVQPNTTYYYKVCAIDKAEQRSELSAEVKATTKMSSAKSL